MSNKFMYIPNDDTQNYPYCKLLKDTQYFILLKSIKPFYLFESYQHVTVAFNLMLILTIYYYQNARDTSTN